MRALIVALALPLLAACDANYAGPEGAENPAGGYTLEVRAVEGAQTYIVTAPDGRQTASRAADGASALLDAAAIQQMGEMQLLQHEAQPEVFALRFPGVDISVSADESDPGSESATVRVNAAGRSVHVDAQEGGPGEGDDAANIRITGASESDAREFIAEAEHISPEVRQQMLSAVGLE